MKGRILRTGVFALLLCGALLAPLAGEAAGQWRRRGGARQDARQDARQGAQTRRADPRLVAQAERVAGDRFQFESLTPRGVLVYSVGRPNPSTVRAIDGGLDQLFAAARRRGYRQRLSHSDYTVFIGRADRQRDSAGAYSPDIAVGAAQYAGSVYDKGGYVFAAGMVLSMEPGAFLIAEHERDFGRISDVARYEGEHIVLYHNDRQLYQRTYDHSRGGSHPIIQ